MPNNLVAQRAELRPASPVILPGISDSNSPVHWTNGNMSIIQSLQLPLISIDTDGAGTFKARAIVLNTYEHYPLWIESTWTDDTGDLYAWYHTEVPACRTMATPKVGALVSHDGGYSFTDLGLIMESAYWPDCNAQNGYLPEEMEFHGVAHSSQEYFYCTSPITAALYTPRVSPLRGWHLQTAQTQQAEYGILSGWLGGTWSLRP